LKIAFRNNQPMSSAPLTQTSRVDITLARAERRREMLQRLAEQGMAIADRLTNRTVAPEIGGAVVQHALAYAKIARGVRLALILEARLEGRILAYGKGDMTALVEMETVSTAQRTREIGRPERAPADADAGSDHDGAGERAEHDRLPAGGFRAWVETICDNLGVDPDWSCWSDEEGFVRDDGQPVTEWPVRKGPMSSLPRSGDGGLAASGREPGGGKAPRLESGEIEKRDQGDTARDPPTPLPP
jgi:hypothetical protein